MMQTTSTTLNIYTDFSSPVLSRNWLELQQTGVLSPFQRFQFIQLMAHHVLPAHNSALRICEITDAAGKPLMILPMILRKTRYARVLEWFDLGLVDYCLPLLCKNVASFPVQIKAQLGQIVAKLGHVDFVHLTKMPAAFDGVENPLMQLPNVLPMGGATFPKYLGDADAVTAFHKSGIHEDYRKRLRKLEREGHGPDWIVAKTAVEVETLFAALVELRKERFAKLQRIDNLQEQAIQSFYLDLAKSGCADGSVCLIALRFNGEIVAVQYGLVHAERCVVIMVGAETQRWRSASPGLINFVRMADWTIEQGLKIFDLGVGDLAYKKRLSPEPCTLYEMHYAITAKGRLLMMMGRGKRYLRATLAAHPRWNQRLRKMFGK